MAEYCTEQLEFLKTKRLFRQLKLYAMWQKQWIAQVRTNAHNRQMREVFRDILLYSSLRRFKRVRRNQIYLQCVQAMREQANETNTVIRHQQINRRARMRSAIFTLLVEHRKRE